jgi:hypothetical protein
LSLPLPVFVVLPGGVSKSNISWEVRHKILQLTAVAMETVQQTKRYKNASRLLTAEIFSDHVNTYEMPSTKNATNITPHSKPGPQNTTGTMVQYVSNATLHADLGISYVQEVIDQKCNKHHTRLENPLLETLLVREENRRLERNWPIDLI